MGWHVFTPAEGLVSNDVRAMAEDSEGRLWLGTSDGAYRYDGHAFTPCPDLAGRHVKAILRDREGRLWFGTDAGVYYQPSAGLAIQPGPILRDSIWTTIAVNSIAQDQEGALWFGTLYGVYRYEGRGEPEQYLREYIVRATWWDNRRHNLWIGTGVGVIRYDGQDFTDVPSAETGRVWAIEQDREGDLWFGTDHGVYRYDEERQAITRAFTSEDGPLYDKRTRAILEDVQGCLWFGTVEGVSRYDKQGVVPFDIPEGLSKRVQAIWQDSKEGCLWFGTTGGLGRFKGHFWQGYTTEHGLPSNRVRAIWRDDRGDLWLGTDNGACCFDGSRFVPHLTGRAVWAIERDKEGALWFGASDGAYRYDGREFEKPPELDGKDVRAIAQDAAGALWFGTDQGVCRLDEGRLVTFTDEDGLASNNVNAILLDSDGVPWVGTSGGVSRHKEGHFEEFDLPYGRLDIPNVLAIQEDGRGDIWFGTNGGVVRYRRQEQILDRRPYLAKREVHSIFQDGLGNLWLGTDVGAYARPGREEAVWEEPAFTTADGLVHDIVLSIWRDDGGDLWFGTLGGLSRYRPGREPPWVRVGLYVGDEDAPRQPSEDGITLNYDEDNVRIKLVGGDFRTHPRDLRYLYQLEGWDKSKVLTSSEEIFYRLEYRKVRGNTDYHFQVQALDRDLNYSSPDNLDITVKAQPPWTMPAFYALVAVATLAYYLVLRRLRKEQRYSDLEVVIGQGEGAFDLWVSASSPRPKAWIAVGEVLRGLGVRPPDLFASRREIVSSPLPTYLPGDEMSSMMKRLRDGAVDGKFLHRLGSYLFDAIFVDEIREHLFKSTRWRRSVRLRLRFQEDALGLASLPWEYMYGGERLGFLGASPQVAVTRYCPPEEVVERSRTTRPLRILAVIANPHDLAKKGMASIDVRGEKERLEAVWREMNAKRQVVEWKFHEEATIEALHSELGKEGYDIVHFIAHGDFEEDRGGLLYLKDEEGNCLRVFEEELSGLFRAYHAQSKRPPALVVLNTCRSAASAEKGALAGLAPTLVREGKLLAAVGMQFRIGDEPAQKFAARFYEALLRNGQVDYAVSMARNAIAVDLGFDIHDWGIPVLYMQTVDGTIFEIT